jgi:hypothetical protein
MSIFGHLIILFPENLLCGRLEKYPPDLFFRKHLQTVTGGDSSVS